MKLFKLQIKRIKFALVLIGLKSKHGSLLLGSPRAGWALHFLHCQKNEAKNARKAKLPPVKQCLFGPPPPVLTGSRLTFKTIFKGFNLFELGQKR